MGRKKTKKVTVLPEAEEKGFIPWIKHSAAGAEIASPLSHGSHKGQARNGTLVTKASGVTSIDRSQGGWG